MKKRRFGILAKLLLVVLVIYAAASLISMSGKIKTAMNDQKEIEKQVEELETENAALNYAIENSDDEKVIEDIARNDLGLVYPGEKVFISD